MDKIAPVRGPHKFCEPQCRALSGNVTELDASSPGTLKWRPRLTLRRRENHRPDNPSAGWCQPVVGLRNMKPFSKAWEAPFHHHLPRRS